MLSEQQLQELRKRSLEDLPKGAECWNQQHRSAHLVDLSNEDLTQFDLSGFNLMHANLRGANLRGVRLCGCKLSGSDLSGANLREADLTGADLSLEPALQHNRGYAEDLDATASFHGLARVPSDVFDSYVRSEEYTRLIGANLFGADLTSAKLGHADLTGADCREVTGLLVDGNRIENTRFSPHANDAWSVLRRKYTGPMLVLNLLLLLAFIIPYIFTAAALISLNRAEGAVTRANGPLRSAMAEPAAKVQNASRAAEDKIRAAASAVETVEREIPKVAGPDPSLKASADKAVASLHATREQLQQAAEFLNGTTSDSVRIVDEAVRTLQPTSENGWKPRSVLFLVLGGESSTVSLLVACLLIAYNVFRTYLTSSISLLREEEERSKVAPEKREYHSKFLIHSYLMRPLQLLALSMLAVHLFEVLHSTVMVPPGM